MLVLARRPDESIVINGEIIITVLGVGRGGQVRLGIEAPRHVQIYRKELLVEISAANQDAAAQAANAAAPADALAAALSLMPKAPLAERGGPGQTP